MDLITCAALAAYTLALACTICWLLWRRRVPWPQPERPAWALLAVYVLTMLIITIGVLEA